MNHEAWLPALIAFYAKAGLVQRAENLRKGWAQLDATDRREIEALAAATELAPRLAA